VQSRILLQRYFAVLVAHEPGKDPSVLLGIGKQIALCHIFTEIVNDDGNTQENKWAFFKKCWEATRGDTHLLPIIEPIFYAESIHKTPQKSLKRGIQDLDWSDIWAIANFTGNIVEDYARSSAVVQDNTPQLKWLQSLKKRQGTFFTPPELARFIAERIEKIWDLPWEDTRIFDPSVGSGSFLLAFAEIYAKRVKNLNQEDFLRFLSHNLFGVDQDPAAVTATALILGITGGDWSVAMAVKENLRQVDALQIDQLEQYHLVVGNPPWGSIRSGTRSIYTKKYPMCNDYENFEYFSVLGLNAVTPGGIHAFIVPNTFFRNTMSVKFRGWYSSHASFLEIHDFSAASVFAEPKVRSSVFIARKNPSQNPATTIFIHTGKEMENSLASHSMPPDWFQAHLSEWHLSLVLPTLLEGIYHPIVQNSSPLSTYADTKQGFIPYRNTTLVARLKLRLMSIAEGKIPKINSSGGILQGIWPAHVPYPPIPDFSQANYERLAQDLAHRIVSERLWHWEGDANSPAPNGYMPLLKGREVRPFSINWGGTAFAYGPHVSSYVEEHYFTRPRLLFPEIMGPPPYLVQAAYTHNPFVHDPQVLNAVFKEGIHPGWHWFCLAAVNSLPISAFMALTSPKAGKGLFEKLLIKDVKRIPIPYSPTVLEQNDISFEDLQESLDLKDLTQIIQRNTLRPAEAIGAGIQLATELTRIYSQSSIKVRERDLIAQLRKLNDLLFCRIFGVDPQLCMQATH